MPSIYGPIVTGAAVRLNVERTIRTYMPDYLAEVAAQSGRARDSLVPFRSFVMADDVGTWNDGQLPACIISVDGLDDAPERDGTSYSAYWSVVLYVVASANSRNATKENVELYTAALRALILQHPSLAYFDPEEDKVVPGIASAIDWLDESYSDGPDEASRTLGAGSIILSVQVENVLDVSLGISNPSENPNLPPAEPVTITDTDVQVRKIVP